MQIHRRADKAPAQSQEAVQVLKQNPRCSATQIPARMGASAMGWMDPVTASTVTSEISVKHHTVVENR